MTGSADGLGRFDSRTIEEWSEACAGAYVPLTITAGPDFRGALRERRIGDPNQPHGPVVTQVGATRSAISRTLRSTQQEPREVVLFSVFLSGHGILTQEGRVAKVPPGGAYLLDGNRPYGLQMEGSNDILVLRLPRTDLGIRSTELRDIVGRLVPPGTAGLPPLRRHLAHLLSGSHRDSTGPHQDARLAIELVGALLHPLLYGDRSRAVLRGDALLASAQWHIERHHTDGSLGIADIADHFVVSRRYLETLFAREQTTPAAYLRRIRLRHAQDLLSKAPQQAVAETARQVGFNDTGTFIRAFRRECGVTPDQWRRDPAFRPEENDGRDAAPLAAQALLTDLRRFL